MTVNTAMIVVSVMGAMDTPLAFAYIFVMTALGRNVKILVALLPTALPLLLVTVASLVKLLTEDTVVAVVDAPMDASALADISVKTVLG